MGHALLRAAAADLELRLARSAPADAAGEAGERVVLLTETRHVVLQLRELHLELAVVALGALREDVENELRAIDDLEVALLRDRGGLRGRELAIEDEHVGVELHRANDHVVELALTEHELRIDAIAELDDGIRDLDAGSPRELAELGDALLGVIGGAALSALANMHEHGAAVLAPHGARARRLPSELGLEVSHELADVDAELAHRNGADLAIRGLARLLRRDVVGVLDRLRVAARPELDRAHEIEAQTDEVHEVVARQRLAPEMRMHQAQPAEATFGGA